MRTLKQMGNDIDQIKSKIDFLQGIAELKRRFVPMDAYTFNSISTAIKQRIEELDEALNDAAQSIGDYAKELSTDVLASRISHSYASEQVADMIEVRNTLDSIATRLNSEIERFNTCLEKAKNHP